MPVYMAGTLHQLNTAGKQHDALHKAIKGAKFAVIVEGFNEYDITLLQEWLFLEVERN